MSTITAADRVERQCIADRIGVAYERRYIALCTFEHHGGIRATEQLQIHNALLALARQDLQHFDLAHPQLAAEIRTERRKRTEQEVWP